MLRRIRAWLAQPSTGIASALLTAALSATGSVLFKFFPNAYNRHLGGWWAAPRWHTIWASALIIVVIAWCCHAVLRVGDSIADRVNRRVNSGSRLGLTVLQLGLALAFGAYVLFEVRPTEEKFVVTVKGTNIYGESYRVLRVEARGRRPGSRRPVTAWLERSVGAITGRLRVSRSQSWASLSGTHQLVMDRANVVSDSVILRHGHQRLELSPSKPGHDGKDTIVLNSIRDPEPESSVSVPKADITIGSRRELLPLDPEWTGENAFLGFKESPVLVLRVRRNLANSLAVVALASLLASAVLFWVRARGASRSLR